MLEELKNFLFRGNIVELAVAFVMGVAFAAVITSLVDNLIMPVIAMIIGKPDFSDLTFTINDAVFRYGAFITSVIQFVAIGAGGLLLRRQAGADDGRTRQGADRGGHARRGAPAPGAARRAARLPLAACEGAGAGLPSRPPRTTRTVRRRDMAPRKHWRRCPSGLRAIGATGFVASPAGLECLGRWPNESSRYAS